MFDQDDFYQEDTLRVGRGIIFGVAIGILLWALLLGGGFLLFKYFTT